jgi:hypothetical protein
MEVSNGGGRRGRGTRMEGWWDEMRRRWGRRRLEKAG